MNQRLWKTILICACLLVANGVLQWLVDEDLGIGWTHNTIRNWEQFGLGTLKGQLVTNPGGYQALEQPEIYLGHRAASLLPAFFIGKLFAWTGMHFLPFHALLMLLILFGMWQLLGRTENAFFIGVVAILCPGYVLWPTSLDPNAIAVLVGIPYAAFVCWQLRQPSLSLSASILLLFVTMVFTAVNWTTALVHMQILLCLFLTRSVTWRRLLLYAVFGITAATVVVGISLASKLSKFDNGSSHFLQMLSGYTWGNTGYNVFGLTALTLLVRLTFINLIGLLPLWLVWVWRLGCHVKSEPARVVAALVPVGLAILQAVAMRNYFSHHPWMAAPLFLLGICLSLYLLPPVAKPADGKTPLTTQHLLIGAASFGFGLVVLLFYHEHTIRSLSLVSLVRSHTARTDSIVVIHRVDPTIVGIFEVGDRFGEAQDRRTIARAMLPDPEHPVAATCLLSDTALPDSWSLVARNEPDRLESFPFISGPLKWFTQTIARRAPGDQMDLAETYYLYRVPSALVAATPSAGHQSPTKP